MKFLSTSTRFLTSESFYLIGQVAKTLSNHSSSKFLQIFYNQYALHVEMKKDWHSTLQMSDTRDHLLILIII